MLDHKIIIKAVLGLIEKYLRRETISHDEYNKVQKMMDTFEIEFKKKNPRTSFSPLADWLIHEQPYLAGTPHASGGSPSYFLECIQAETEGGEPVVERLFRHCSELFGIM